VQITRALTSTPVLAAAVGALAVASSVLARRAPVDVLHGVRLGMTPSEVRASFDGGMAGDAGRPGGEARGRWEAAPGCAGGALVWTGEGASPEGVRWARFEFHDGQMMAARLRVAAADPSARGDHLVSSSTAVLAREPTEAGAALVLLARGCEQHEAEVTALLAGAPLRR
jgi:hypothetical protein